MQFNVPQFETEDKLVGPFTVGQFLYIAAASVVSFLLFPLLAIWFWFAVSVILVGGSLAFALIKVGGRPMPIFLLSAAYYLWEPKTLIQLSKLAEIVSPAQARPLPPAKKSVIPNKPAAPSIASSSVPPPPIAPALPSSKIVPDILVKKPDISIKPTTPFVSPDIPTPIVSPVPDPIISSSDFIEKISPLRNISNKMLTYSSSIPFREAGLIQSPSKKQGYEFIQKPTGETIVARRVDYR